MASDKNRVRNTRFAAAFLSAPSGRARAWIFHYFSSPIFRLPAPACCSSFFRALALYLGNFSIKLRAARGSIILSPMFFLGGEIVYARFARARLRLYLGRMIDHPRSILLDSPLLFSILRSPCSWAGQQWIWPFFYSLQKKNCHEAFFNIYRHPSTGKKASKTRFRLILTWLKISVREIQGHTPCHIQAKKQKRSYTIRDSIYPVQKCRAFH